MQKLSRCLIGACLLLVMGTAAAQDQTIDFNIPPQALSSALGALARQAHLPSLGR
ncbi:MAG: hypothetical protein ACREYE_31485 [Gammaproteobacteria bacterium]